MTIKVALQHSTHYTFDKRVSLSPHIIRLRPAPHCQTEIGSFSLNIEPKNHFINWQQDPFGNYLAYVVFPEMTESFHVDVDLTAEINIKNPFDFFLENYVEEYPFEYHPHLAQDLLPYCQIKENGPLLCAYRDSINRKITKTVDLLVDINRRINEMISYVVRLEPGVQTCEETLSKKTGSCRDMAWLLTQLLRMLGFATRFSSGYLIQLKPDMKSLDGPSGAECDFTDLHAWTEVYLPGAGWIGLDPTSGLLAGEGHIPLSSTPDPMSAAAITGTVDPCNSTMDFSMSVTRIHEDRRVTKPYSHEEWQAIDTLGDKIDKVLKQQDVRLTMGGEPTFVSIDDMNSVQWTVAALGAEKYQLAVSLLKKLKSRFAEKGLLHYTQGKWYGGEPLPRWSLNCYWRTDGETIWNDETLLADVTKDGNVSHQQAMQFINDIAEVLAIKSDYILTAREADNSLVGMVLPLLWSTTRKQWISNHWNFANQSMTLIQGDSPLGYRLPLDQVPFVKESEEEIVSERSLFAETDPIPSYKKQLSVIEKRLKAKNPQDVSANDPFGLVRTALCVEVRSGRLYLFMPPTSYIEHYLELVAVIEKVAHSLQVPVVIEGYGPPRDLRIKQFNVTPDPGVIEVNIHPTSHWQDLVNNTHILYEEARLIRLGTEKFMIDGRHSGTGGGNHITLGGATPSDSPFLRRPDLIRSLITYWQHHPSLSYLFSGSFIGPTSQAPRIDEARHDALYELEIAFAQIEAHKESSPWLVDRLLRNLLVDVSGNTHRAEICIDKLYSPGLASGRQGLVELRAFEMPPHPQMSLVQNLLVRTLIAYFWQHPYDKDFIRWGTSLHDRFMLPHYVLHDCREIISDLNKAGYPFELKWLEPFYEFRFPTYGRVQIEELTLECRMALEPWHVLGEDNIYGATSRGVDSAVERLQLKVSGMTSDRYVLMCNGFRVPLHPTQTAGEWIAGIRFKAWAPPFTLHPNIPVHSPLVFDVVDVYHQRSMGGCVYHVAHPGGRNYEHFPVNSNEAEARRLSRFQPFGHTVGKVDISPSVTHPEFPYTLDLRRMKPR